MTEAPDWITPDEPPADVAGQIRELSAELVGLIDTAERKKCELDELYARIHELSARTIPDKMMEAHMDICGLPELGVDVRMKDWTRAVLPRPGEDGSMAARDAATAWLDDHGYGALIKTEVTAQFDKTERNMALSAAEGLRQEFPDKRVIVREDAHHMTYTAWAKGELKAGVSLPLDLLGITTGKIAEVVNRKEEK